MYPILYQYGPFTIQSSGAFLLAGVLASLWFFRSRVRTKKIDINFLTQNIIWFILLGVIGARIGDILLHLSDYTFLSVFYPWEGGLNFYAGILCFVFGFAIICKRNNKKFWRYIDSFAFPFFIVMLFVSFGDYFSGANYGSPPGDSFWPTVVFNSAEVRYSLPIHPVQFYAAFVIVLSMILGMYLRKKRRAAGVYSLSMFLVYFSGEFLLEFLRGDPIRLIYGYRSSQIFDVVFILLIIIFLIIQSHHKFLKIKSISS